jgi:methylamine dehydrogenase light chain
MSKPKGLDRVIEGMTRTLAQRSSRRGVLARLATLVVGGAALPLLPVDRSFGARQAFAATAQTTDPTQCNYWRYCAAAGYQCACCGGGPSTCPPGTQPAPTSWIGTCLNPDDGKTYLIAYRDCCGKDSCGRCPCQGLEGEMPIYRPHLSQSIVWCFGAPSMVYHCSSSALVGEA